MPQQFTSRLAEATGDGGEASFVSGTLQLKSSQNRINSCFSPSPLPPSLPPSFPLLLSPPSLLSPFFQTTSNTDYFVCKPEGGKLKRKGEVIVQST